MIHAKRTLIICTALLCLVVDEAAAKSAKKQARAHAKKAATAFQAKDYATALQEFNKAFELIPAAPLLYNIGQCHVFLGNHQLAISFFNRFLEERPDTPHRPDVEKLIRASRKDLEEQERARAEAEKKKQEEAKPPPPPPPDIIVQKPPPPADDSPGVHETWWFWTIIGVVAVGTTVGVVAASSGDTITVLPSGNLGVIDRR